MNLIYSCELFFSGRRESALRASRAMLWAPQRRGGLDTIGAKPLMGCDILALVLSNRGPFELQAWPENRAVSPYFSGKRLWPSTTTKAAGKA